MRKMINLAAKLLKKTTSKIGLLIAILAILTSLGFAGNWQQNIALAQQGDSFCGSLSGDYSGFLDCDQDVTSFTQFDGGLRQLDAEGFDPNLTRASDARSFISLVLNFALGFLGIIALAVIIYGGFLYVTAAGNSDQADKGKTTIVYSVIGIVIIFAAFPIVNTLLDLTQSDGGSIGINNGSGQIRDINLQQLAQYNSAAAETKDITIDFVRAYENYFNQIEAIQQIQEYEVGRLTSRQDLINYLTFVRQQMEYLERQGRRTYQIAVNDGDSIDADLLTNTGIAARVTINSVIDPGLRILNRQIADETREEEIVKNFRNGYGSFLDDLRKFGDDLVEGVNDLGRATDNFFRGKDGGFNVRVEDVNCYLPPSEREVDFNFDCVGAFEKSQPNTGQGISQALNAYLNEIVIEKGINVDYDDQIDDLRSRLDDLRGSLEDYGGTNIIAELDRAFDDADNAFVNVYADDIYFSFVGTPARSSDAFTPTGEFNNIQANIDKVRAVIESMSELHDQLSQLKFVNAIVTASPRSGNAPLVVQFDATNSYDPADQSLVGDGAGYTFEWDLDGDGTSKESTPDCIEANQAIVTCTYREPGAYRAKLKVFSNNPDEVAPGIVYVSIAVREPVTKIDLAAEVGGEEITIRRYDEDGNLERDIDRFKVTLSEASESGIIFDASGTEDNGGPNIIRYSWNFGNQDPIQSGSELSRIDSPAVRYFSNGTYRVVLEVEDEVGNIDRKFVDVIVSSLAANLNANQTAGDLNTEFIFDASSSRSDGSNISSYEWQIEGVDNLDADNSDPVLRHKFDSPGVYTVSVTVSDDLENTDTASVDVLVASQAPQAYFDIAKNPDQPSLVLLDASSSFDPDPNDTLTYNWTIFNASEGSDYEIISGELSGEGETSKQIELKFNRRGSYVVQLTVNDQYDDQRLRKQGSVQKELIIDSLVDLRLGPNHEDAEILNDEGEAEVTMEFLSEFADNIEINFGDGSNPEVGSFVDGKYSTVHIYKASQIFRVSATASTTEGESNSLTTSVTVGRGDSIIPVARVEYQGVTYTLDSNLPVISRDQRVTFDASRSINNDGTSSGLEYSWNFGDGGFAEGIRSTHTYQELAPNPPGHFEVTLTVTNDQGASEQLKFELRVQSVPPVIQSITATALNSDTRTPVEANQKLISPLPVRVEAQGVSDPDGEVSKYRFYYFDLNNPQTELGATIVESDSAELNVEILGVEGEVKEFAFCVDITDNEGNELNCLDAFNVEQLPTLEVENGRNERPTAKFSVDRTDLNVGEEITFSSLSEDPDGEIVSYQWDIDGDGSFANDEPRTEAGLVHIYERRSPSSGYQVRLKVTDDNGASAVSTPISIFVDSILEEPVAAFRADVLDSGFVSFKNNSTADLANGGFIQSYIWDLDLSFDTDGDGQTDNDVDSTEVDLNHQYDGPGTYRVKLIVVDNEGNTDTVTNSVVLSSSLFTLGSGPDQPTNTQSQPTSQPTTGTSGDLEAVLTANPAINSATNTIYLSGDYSDVTFAFAESKGNINRITIDKNIFFDTNGGTAGTPGDGIRNNDIDYEAVSKGAIYTTQFRREWEPIELKLTIYDNQGNIDTQTVKIVFGNPPTGTAALIPGIVNLKWLWLLLFVGISVSLYVKGFKAPETDGKLASTKFTNYPLNRK